MALPEVSIIVPVYRNLATLHELYRRVREVLERQGLSYEVLFVEDACPEGSLRVLKELADRDPHVSVLALEKNVGPHRAVFAGLTRAQGKWVVAIDADLQDPPEAVPELLAKLHQGFAAAFAGRRGQYESRLRLVAGRLFRMFVHLLCGLPKDAGLYVAINRQMVARLMALGEPFPSLTAMMAFAKLPLVSVPVIRARRPRGQSAYTFWKRFKFAVLTIGQILILKCLRTSRLPSESTCKIPVKTYMGARFSSSVKASEEGENVSTARV